MSLPYNIHLSFVVRKELDKACPIFGRSRSPLQRSQEPDTWLRLLMKKIYFAISIIYIYIKICTCLYRPLRLTCYAILIIFSPIHFALHFVQYIYTYFMHSLLIMQCYRIRVLSVCFLANNADKNSQMKVNVQLREGFSHRVHISYIELHISLIQTKFFCSCHTI